MTKYEVLNQLNTSKMKSREAYKLLFEEERERKPRRAGFIVIRIQIPESKGATMLLSFLLFLPIPLFLVKMFIPRRIKNKRGAVTEQLPLTPEEMIDMISIRGVKVDVKTHDKVRIFIKTI